MLTGLPLGVHARAVVGTQFDERPYFMQVPRDGPIPHLLALGGVGSNPSSRHNEKRDFLLEQLAFLGFQLEAGFS